MTLEDIARNRGIGPPKKKIHYQETSREAWKSWRDIPSDTLDGQILAVLFESKGLACWEIEQVIGNTHQAVSGNLRHLVEKGFVRDSGRKGRSESGKRTVIIWELCE